MSTTTQGFGGERSRTYAVLSDPDLAIVVLFCALGLLASVYFMTHFPLSVDDAMFLNSWL